MGQQINIIVLVLGVVLGASVAPSLYFLIQFIGIRSRSFVSFGLYGLNLFAWLLVHWLEPNSDWLHPTLGTASLIGLTLYTFSFLRLWNESVKFKWLFSGLIALSSLQYLAVFDFSEFFSIFVHIAVYTILFWLALRSKLTGFGPSIYVTIAIGIGIIALLLVELSPQHDAYYFTIGCSIYLIHNFILATGLSNRINNMKSEHERTQKITINRLNELQKLNDEINANLEAEIKDRTRKIITQKEEIIDQGKKMLNLYTQIRENIETARSIQQSMLPDKTVIDSFLPNSFIYSRPKDLISGDFYFFEAYHNKLYIATVDCTGHGVAGAFTSLIANNLLMQAVYSGEMAGPAGILRELNITFISSLQQNNHDPMYAAGMDIGFCVLDEKTLTLDYSAARSHGYVIRGIEIIDLKGNKLPIGLQRGGKTPVFKNQRIQLQKGDRIYLFSDGFADQIGGESGYDKFMYPRFRQLLVDSQDLPMNEQMRTLDTALRDWMGNAEQLDDILVLGFSID